MVILPHRRKAFRTVPASEGGGGGDPYWNQVVLLLHCDGTNGSTTITDSSPVGRTVTANGNAQISTAESKFGGASLLLDGSGDTVTMASSADFAFGTGDFTIETFLRYSNNVGFQIPWSFNDATSNMLRIQNGNFALLLASNSTILSGSIPTLANGTWYHLAVVRSGNNWTLYIDGVSALSATSGATYAGTMTMKIGDNGGANFFNGRLDEFRITKGVARYTSNFTPPTQAFPNS